MLSAQDEILLLQQVAEKAASERDIDIATLQEELKKVRGELERWRKEASEYEKEIVSLQASFQLRCQQCEVQQKEEVNRLQGKKAVSQTSANSNSCLKLSEDLDSRIKLLRSIHLHFLSYQSLLHEKTG